ncbi:MAG TPA: 3-hydroxyacyl-ACP dehydratase FabZ [Longimicrobium sp.]|jgi:3-hydroxyacyl-[acyl-carrier-protein] dehydratase|uniref:3-hydroxyacyl-ACP dehydratase FabZ n=1 Tax=Longimicrobium sp. TaxID=2029185 RepID=UPI002ED87D93
MTTTLDAPVAQTETAQTETAEAPARTPKTVSHAEIREILPHRDFFLMVDRVLDYDDTSIRAVKNVTATEPFFRGHFPDAPVFPGVMLIEACGQTGGIMLAKSERFNTRGYLAQVNDFKFLGFAGPGDTLILSARFVSALGSFAKVSVEAETAEGRKVARGTISYFFDESARG